MTLLRGRTPLDDARRDGRAIPGFVAYNLETAQAIVAAAERTALPTILQAGASAFRFAGLEPLACLAVQLAESSDAQVGVHLDHSRSLREVERCLALGYTSVMFDGSHLPYEENVVATAEVVRRARSTGAWVEAELVGIAGDEDVSTGATAEALTEPDQAADFVERTGVDALAVAVGNVHGFTAEEPRIDLERLAALRDAVPVPLVLHGASGLSPRTLAACVARGVAKVNVNTELRRAYLGALADRLDDAIASTDLVQPLEAAREAVAEAAAGILIALAGSRA